MLSQATFLCLAAVLCGQVLNAQAWPSLEVQKELVPGIACSRAIKLLGTPTKRDKSGYEWKTKLGWVLAGSQTRAGKCTLQEIILDVPNGMLALPSGVVLGRDTVADVVKKLALDPSTQSIEAPEGKREAHLSIPPRDGAGYWTAYVSEYDEDLSARLRHTPRFSEFAAFRVKMVYYSLTDKSGPIRGDQ